MLDIGFGVGIFALFEEEIPILDKLQVSDDIFLCLYLLHQFLGLGEPAFLEQERKLVEVYDISLLFGHFKLTLQALVKHPQDLVSMFDGLSLSKEELVVVNHSSYVLIRNSPQHRVIGIVDAFLNVLIHAPFHEISKQPNSR